MRIRTATLDDVPALLALGPQIHAESRHAALPFDANKTGAALRAMIERTEQEQCFLIAIGSDGDIIGFFIGYAAEYFFSRDQVATDVLFYVKPEHRGSSAAVKLIHAFRKWALARQVAEMRICMTTGVAIDRFDRFVRRLGFQYTGGNYSMWLEKAAKTDVKANIR